MPDRNSIIRAIIRLNKVSSSRFQVLIFARCGFHLWSYKIKGSSEPANQSRCSLVQFAEAGVDLVLETWNLKLLSRPAVLPDQRHKGAGAMIFLLETDLSFNNSNQALRLTRFTHRHNEPATDF